MSAKVLLVALLFLADRWWSSPSTMVSSGGLSTSSSRHPPPAAANDKQKAGKLPYKSRLKKGRRIAHKRLESVFVSIPNPINAMSYSTFNNEYTYIADSKILLIQIA